MGTKTRRRQKNFFGVLAFRGAVLGVAAVTPLVWAGYTITPQKVSLAAPGGVSPKKGGGSTQAGQNQFDDITGEQVLNAIVKQYPDKFTEGSKRVAHCASYYNVFNVPGFTATINGLTGVGVTFSSLKVLTPTGEASSSNTLVFQTTIHHANYQPRQMGYLKLRGFLEDVVLTKDNANDLMNFRYRTLTISDQVTVVAYNFPEDFLYGVTTLNLPANLNVIEAGSFQYCSQLQAVDLRNVIYVGDFAFGSSPLLTLTAAHLEVVGNYAFRSAKLKKWDLPTSLLGVGNGAFYQSPLTGVWNLPNTLQKIGSQAFRSALVSQVTVDGKNSQLRFLGAQAFADAPITSLTLPDNLPAVGDGAFQNAPLTTLSLGSHLVTVGNGAFRNAKTRSLTIPSSVVTIGDLAFGSDNLTTLVVQNTTGSPSHLARVGDNAFLTASLTSFDVPESVVFVGENAFANSVVADLHFEGPYRDNLFLGNNAFAGTNPNNVSPDEWLAITLKYPNAFGDR